MCCSHFFADKSFFVTPKFILCTSISKVDTCSTFLSLLLMILSIYKSLQSCSSFPCTEAQMILFLFLDLIKVLALGEVCIIARGLIRHIPQIRVCRWNGHTCDASSCCFWMVAGASSTGMHPGNIGEWQLVVRARAWVIPLGTFPPTHQYKRWKQDAIYEPVYTYKPLTVYLYTPDGRSLCPDTLNYIRCVLLHWIHI